MTRHGRRPERRPELGPRCRGRGNAAPRADPAGGGAPLRHGPPPRASAAREEEEDRGGAAREEGRGRGGAELRPEEGGRRGAPMAGAGKEQERPWPRRGEGAE